MAWTPVMASFVGGEGRSSVVPSPSWAGPFAPQQRTPPAVVGAEGGSGPAGSAQVCSGPAVIALTSVRTSAAGGLSRFVVVPSPSWPRPFSPQQRTPPVFMSAQVWYAPAAIAFTPASTSVSGGDGRSSPVPSP